MKPLDIRKEIQAIKKDIMDGFSELTEEFTEVFNYPYKEEKYETKTYYKNNTTLFSICTETVCDKEEKYYRAEVALPGFSANEISIKIIGNVIKITANTNRNIKNQSVNYIYDLPNNLDYNSVNATYSSGLIILTGEIKNGENEITIPIR